MSLGVVLVVGLGLLGGYLVSSAGDRSAVVAVRGPIAAGEVIEAGDLVEASVSGVPNAIGYDEVNDIVGQVAAVDVVDGQILTSAMLTTEPLPGTGEAVVGLALDATRAPAVGLAPGDTVTVIAVSPGDVAATSEELDTPTELAAGAIVVSVGGSTSPDTGGSGNLAGGQVVVTLVVDEGDATRVAAYSTANQVAVVQTSPRTATDEDRG